MRTAPHLILVILIVVSIPTSSNSQAPFAQESPAKPELREAVFRYLFDHC